MSSNTDGAKLIFSRHGKQYYYPKYSQLADNDKCWAYLGEVSLPYDPLDWKVGGQPTLAEGQTVHVLEECINLGTLVHLVLHSLGEKV